MSDGGQRNCSCPNHTPAKHRNKFEPPGSESLTVEWQNKREKVWYVIVIGLLIKKSLNYVQILNKSLNSILLYFNVILMVGIQTVILLIKLLQKAGPSYHFWLTFIRSTNTYTSQHISWVAPNLVLTIYFLILTIVCQRLVFY